MKDNLFINDSLADLRMDDDGNLWLRYIHNDEMISLGHAPRPKTRWQTFVYHVCHGLIMHYPLWDILIWSWKNRDSFEDSEYIVDDVEG